MQMDMTGVDHTLSQSVDGTLHCAEMMDHGDCCDSESNMPCSGDNGCMTPCPNFSAAPAVLGSFNNLERLNKSSNVPPYNLSNTGILSRLNAPPPRN